MHMSEHWDFYLSRVDDAHASFFVDMGIARDAPFDDLRYMAHVRLFMKSPREDGLSSNEEFDTLNVIEDVLSVRLCSDKAAYVGRYTTAGFRDFVFYIAAPNNWDKDVAKAMKTHPSYEYESGAREEADWSTYFDFLLPNVYQRRSMSNRQVCQALEEHGDKMDTPREVDHWCYFPDDKSADAFWQEVSALGFQLRVRSNVNDDDEADREAEVALPIRVQSWRSDVPSFDNIDDITHPLVEAAEKYGGNYDGWETFLVKEKK
jgi:regulator of RNase E activity RraB